MKDERAFDDLSVSEKIAVLSGRFYGTEKLSRERIGREYGMAGRNVTRYIRCGRLIPGFRDMLDDGTLTMAAGVEISFLSESEQETVLDVMERNGIRLSRNIAQRIRAVAGSITTGSIEALFGVDKPVGDIKHSMCVISPPQLYSRYFGDVAVRDVQGMVEEALEQYFERKGA